MTSKESTVLGWLFLGLLLQVRCEHTLTSAKELLFASGKPNIGNHFQVKGTGSWCLVKVGRYSVRCLPTCVTEHTEHFSFGLGLAQMENYFLLAK